MRAIDDKVGFTKIELAGALEAARFGLLRLDRNMNVCYADRSLIGLLGLPTGAGAQCAHNGIEHAALPIAFAELLRAVCKRPRGRWVIEFGGKQFLVCWSAHRDSGIMLICGDLTEEFRKSALDAEERVRAELRFSTETLEDQASQLATMAETADQAARALAQEVDERRRLEAKLRAIANTDALTGALSRAGFMAVGQRSLEHAQRKQQALSLLMLDIDFFKTINDRHGHAGGDVALRHLVNTLRNTARATDLVGRLGGEEFAIILPAATVDLARRVAERFRRKVEKSPAQYESAHIAMTVSIGVDAMQPGDSNLDLLLGRADAALYAAKRGGRNQVVVYQASAAD